jgi:hypothetical protein
LSATQSSPIVKLRFLFPVIAVGAALSGCLSNNGNSLPPPNGVQAAAGDSIAGVTWISQIDAVYFVFGSNSPNLTAFNWTDPGIGGFPLNNQGTKAQPPALLCSVPNGLAYYFTVNARTGTAPGGTGSPLVTSTGRPAGGQATWRVGSPIPASVNGVGYATITTCLATGPGTGIFAAVGPAGAIFSSYDAVSWVRRSPANYTTDLYAVTAISSPNNVNGPALLFVAVGAGGAAITSTDGATWTPTVTSSGLAPTLRAISLAGNTFVAVGDGGRILTTVDGTNWAAQASNTTVNLHAVQCESTTCVAVGDAGVIDVSFDGGASWAVDTVGGGTTALRAVAYGNDDDNMDASGVIGENWVVAIDTWVVVGDNGSAFKASTLSTGVTSGSWTPVPIAGAASLIGIGYSTRFVAIDAVGNVFGSLTGAAGSWSAAVPSGVVNPAAMTGNGHGSTSPIQLSPTFWLTTSVLDNSHGFVVVGSAGDNASSF